MTRLVIRSGRVGLTRMWTRFDRRGSAFGVADDPAHGIAGGDGAGADQLFALLQGDVRHLPRRGIDLIERALDERIDLNGVDVAAAGRLHAGGGIGLIDALARIARLGAGRPAGNRLELPRQRQRLRQFDDFDGLGRIGFQARPAARRRS